MYASARPRAMALATPKQTAKLCQAVQNLVTGSSISCLNACAGCNLAQRPRDSSKRHFSITPRASIKEVFPPPNKSPNIKTTPPAWHHPAYTKQQMKDIEVAHRKAQNWTDHIAFRMTQVLRFGMDTATGYAHHTEVSKRKGISTGLASLGLEKLQIFAGPAPMNERKWLVRFLFLESVAGVPGMVAAVLRHLHSLRRMKRDNGWIETLLEEAYNERMHLLTFMKLAEPGFFMRCMILGAQGVFFNGMFLSYLISPRICHRFVGYLEEEAVLTYTRAIEDIEAGRLPKWEKLQAPDIAVNYWNMPEGYRSMKDLLLYIRADEAKHREVNHTLGNLNQNDDPNPFVSKYEDTRKPHPGKDIENIKSTGWERKDIM